MRVTIHGRVELGENADEFGDDKTVLVEAPAVDVGMDLLELGKLSAAMEERHKAGFQDRLAFAGWGREEGLGMINVRIGVVLKADFA